MQQKKKAGKISVSKASSQKSFCIICGNETNGIEVENDFVINSIRWLKTKVTKNVKNNRLVVCKACYPKYKEQRKRYESRQRLYLAFGIIFAFLSIVVSPRIGTVLISAAVVLFLYLMSLLSYMPKIRIGIKK